MIGRSGERWSGIFVLAARYDDDDDIYIVRLDLFGAADTQKGKNDSNSQRRQTKEARLRVEQRLLKKRHREMPDERESAKKLSVVKEGIIVIA